MVAYPYAKLHQDDSQFESYSKTKIKKNAVRSTVICLLLTLGILSFLIPVSYKLMGKRESSGRSHHSSHRNETTENTKKASTEHPSATPSKNSSAPAPPRSVKANLTKFATIPFKPGNRKKAPRPGNNSTVPNRNVSRVVTKDARSFLNSTSAVRSVTVAAQHPVNSTGDDEVVSKSDWLQWRRQKFEAFQWLVELYADHRYHYAVPIILGTLCAVVSTLSVWTVIIIIKNARRARRKAQLGRLVNNLQDNSHTLSSDYTSEEDV